MNKTDIIDAIAAQTKQTKADVAEFLNSFKDVVEKALCEGKDITFTGLFAVKVKKRPERNGRNPRTGEQMMIPATSVVTFSAGKTLKEAVKEALKEAPKAKKK